MSTRRAARRAALEFLYQLDVSDGPNAELPAAAVDEWCSTRGADGRTCEFVRDVALGVSGHSKDIDGMLNRYARDWTLVRMAVIDRNILRLALYEMLYREDIPVNVSINEAVELAKTFGDEESGAFINGILGNIKREMEKE